MPNLVRMFTQSNTLAEFQSSRPEYDEEAEHKTTYANWVFFNQHDGPRILHDMFKDGNLQYTGVVKVYHDDSLDTEQEEYTGNEYDLFQLQQDERFEVKKVKELDNGQLLITGDRINSKGRQKIVNIPPDELMISKRARDFIDPPFIGQRTPKTRSDLVRMGFDKNLVQSLSKDENIPSEVNIARDENDDGNYQHNPTSDTSKDIIHLGEYYVYMDKDGDGISELWQVFYANGKVLEMTQVDEHPYAVFVPIPMPHRAIGTCPADQAADIQYRKSYLLREANNNIAATNVNRVVANERVNLDDLLTPRHGGVVRIEGGGPIGDSVMPMMVNGQVPAILDMIAYSDSELEKRTGVTSYNQGLDTESLNKTATGFQGVRDMSQMRIEQMATLAASGPITKIFNRIIALASKHQDENTEIRVNGQPFNIDPREWRYKASCKINVGTGAGDKQARIANLENMMRWSLDLMDRGSPCSDWDKFYAAYKKLIVETGLKDTTQYANDPNIPEQQLMAENQMLKQQLQQMQQLQQNPLAEAEQVKAQSRLIEQQQKQQHEMNMKMADMEQKDQYHSDDMAVEITKLELQAQKDYQGGLNESR